MSGVDTPYQFLTPEMPSKKDLERLPKPDPPFEGIIAPSVDDSSSDFPQPVEAPKDAPNIVLIMTDDVGFGAASTFGGPAETKTMSKLAEDGVRYNRFHTTSLCSPTRAALLTGRNPHNASTGTIMERAVGYPGYNSIMPKSCGTIAQTLQMNGYSTAWFGKNHNVPDWETSHVGPFDHWPTSIGFEKFYGFIGGDCNQWNPNIYDGTVPLQPALNNPGYHLDADLADKAIDWVKEKHAIAPEKPFFLYYVPGATHAPHHVPEKWIKKYEGKFNHGWDEQREITWRKQKSMGIIPNNAELTQRPANISAWDSHTPDEQKVYSRMMEIYAAFLEYTDYNIGRVLQTIDDTGKMDNTLVIYIQGDNGGSAEGTEQGTTNELAHLGNKLPEPFSYIQEHVSELGGPMHYNHFPVAWAWAMNSPMQWTKRFASHFGGTRNGMVMRWPRKMIKSKGMLATQFHHVIDVAATVLEASGVKWPVTVINGIKQKEIDGIPMNYTWDPKCANEENRKVQVFEMWGNRGIYSDGWLACTTPLTFPWGSSDLDEASQVPSPDDFEWELYNLKKDFTQGINLMDKENVTDEYRKILKGLKALWWQQAAKYQILPIILSETESLNAIAERPSYTYGRKKFIYENGITGIPEGAAPALRNISYTITAYISIPGRRERANGVIITQGGRFGGWGIVIIENKPIWVYKCSQMESQQKRIDWPDELNVGLHKIQVHYEYTPEKKAQMGGPGTWTMSIDDGESKSASLGFSVGGRFSVTETLDIGQDSGTPILEEYADNMPFKYNGEILRVVIDLDDSNQTVRGLLGAELAKMHFDHATE